MRWPKGPPHLALNPPYFCFCLFVCVCVFFVPLFLKRKLVFPPKKGHFVFIFQCFPFFPNFLFHIPFSLSLGQSLSLSLSLSLPLSLVFFFSFLFVLFCFILLPFVGHFFLYFLLLFREKNINILKFKVCFSSILSVSFGCLSLCFIRIPFYFCFIPIFKFCLLFNINVLLRKSQA